MNLTERKYIMLLVLFASTVMLGGGVGYGKLYSFHIMFATVIVISFFYLRRNSKSLSFKSLPQLMFIFMPLWYAMTIVWSWNRNYSIKYLLLVFIGCGLAWLVCVIGQNKKHFSALIKGAGIVIVIETVLGLLEAFTPIRWPISPFSDISGYFGNPDSLHHFPDHILPTIEITPTGFHWNPNNLAIVLTLATPFTLLRKENWIRIGLTTAMFFVIIMTGSRLCILTTSLIMLSVLWMRRFRYFIIGTLTYITLLSIMVCFSPQINKTLMGRKIYEMATLYDSVLAMAGIGGDEEDLSELEIDPDAYQESGVARMTLMKNGFKALKETKGLGVGGGGSVAVQEKNSGYIGGTIKSMHNFWVEMMVDAGVLFFLIFATWYLYVCRSLYLIVKKLTNNNEKYHANALLLSMIFFVPAAVSASSVIYFLPMWFIFGLAVAFIIIHQPKKNEDSVDFG